MVSLSTLADTHWQSSLSGGTDRAGPAWRLPAGQSLTESRRPAGVYTLRCWLGKPGWLAVPPASALFCETPASPDRCPRGQCRI